MPSDPTSPLRAARVSREAARDARQAHRCVGLWIILAAACLIVEAGTVLAIILS
jgi:hypothetical protein